MFERFFFYCSTSIIILMDSTVPRSVDNGQSSSKSFFSLVKWDIEGIDGIRCRDICFFFFFFYVSLIIICCSEMILLVYTRRCSSSIWKFFFLFFFLHKHTRLRSVGREISLRSRREETEKDRDGKVLVLLPAEAFFFFLKPETHLSAVVFQKENEGMRKQLRQMWTLGTRPSVRQWCSPYFLFSFLLLRGENFIYRLEGSNFKHSLFPVRDEIFLFHFSYCFVSFFRILHIYIYILRRYLIFEISSFRYLIGQWANRYYLTSMKINNSYLSTSV